MTFTESVDLYTIYNNGRRTPIDPKRTIRIFEKKTAVNETHSLEPIRLDCFARLRQRFRNTWHFCNARRLNIERTHVHTHRIQSVLVQKIPYHSAEIIGFNVAVNISRH